MATKAKKKFPGVSALVAQIAEDNDTTIMPRLMRALKAGDKISTLDGLKRFGTIRLAEYIRRLRTKHGMKIITDIKIANNGKRYAQYRLA